MEITPAQCRAARGLLGWSQSELASSSKVGLMTIKRFEAGSGTTRPLTLSVIRQTLELNGIVFIDDNGQSSATPISIGVALARKPLEPK